MTEDADIVPFPERVVSEGEVARRRLMAAVGRLQAANAILKSLPPEAVEAWCRANPERIEATLDECLAAINALRGDAGG